MFKGYTFELQGVSERVGSEVDIDTPNHSTSCGVKLEVGSSYILMGNTVKCNTY